jgi:hypothetical protein
VIEELVAAIKRQGDRHVLYFAFKNDADSRTSHYLVFVTKHPRGHQIMKDIMAKESSWSEGGVPSYTCTAVPREATLFDALEDPLADLERDLLRAFAGRTMTVGQVCAQHGLTSDYTPTNYKTVLKRLEAANRIKATPPASGRPPNTMADRVVIQFPQGDS